MRQVRTAPGATKAAQSKPNDAILYVEDEDDNWYVAEQRLGKHYIMKRARNAAEACSELGRSAGEIRVVLMDIQLRGSQLDGLQLTRLIRGTLPNTESAGLSVPNTCRKVPIIFVTAYSARYDEGELRRAGGDQMLSKPVDFSALNTALVRHYLKRFTQPSSTPSSTPTSPPSSPQSSGSGHSR